MALDENKKTALSCLVTCGMLVVIITLIMISIIASMAYYFIKRYRTNASKNYKMSIVQYCQNLPAINYTSTVTKPKTPGTYEYNLSKALLDMSLFVTQSNCLNISPIPNPPGFTQQYRIVGLDPADQKRRMFATIFTDFVLNTSSNEEVNAKAAKGNKKFMIVFTGTFTMNEWKNDFTYPLVEGTNLNNYAQGIQVHKGFYGVYSSIRDQLWKLYSDNKNQIGELYITGHSLGGALSTICAFDFAKEKPTHYSFAAPRSGNVSYSNTFNLLLPTSLRIYNIEDIIHSVPPAEFFGGFVYQHTNNGIPFDVNLGSVGANHITSYLNYLPKCVQNSAPCDNSNSVNVSASEETVVKSK